MTGAGPDEMFPGAADARWRHLMTEALLRGSDVDLYRTSGYFRVRVDALVAMLPDMVHGLAEGAKIDEQRRADVYRRIMRQPPDPTLTRDLLDWTPPEGPST